ncbi:hypothetical protein IID22_05030 [Patescibacteria group bacterium]|nr:hypothetical protein [Patescibacteria group bacterium]
MTEDSGSQVDKAARESRHSTFECASCGSGTENFLTLFKDGGCSHCGAPAGVVVETSRPENIQKIQQSVVLIAPKGEEDNAAQIMRELLGKGISVIDPQIVVENEQAGNRANVLAFLVENSKFVLVIPPREGQFSEDRLVPASVEQAMTSNKNNVIPLYPDESYIGRSIFLDTKLGVLWEGEAGKSWDKNRFLNYLTANKEVEAE